MKGLRGQSLWIASIGFIELRSLSAVLKLSIVLRKEISVSHYSRFIFFDLFMKFLNQFRNRNPRMHVCCAQGTIATIEKFCILRKHFLRSYLQKQARMLFLHNMKSY